MKKIFILTAVFALLTLSLNAQITATKKVVKQTAQTEKVVTPQNGSMKAPNRATVTGSVTAAEGTSTSTGYQWLPVYGWYFESAQTNQMIYTATQLDGLQPGDKITSLSFYPNGNIAFSGGSITLSLGNTSISQFSSNAALSVSTTQVARVTTYPVSNGAWTITFTNPFVYTGENILVQVATTSGNYGTTSFYGQDQSNYQSRNSYGSTNRYYFLPKVTLAYERSTDPEISASINSVSFKCQPGETPNQTVNVTGLNLTGNITATISGTNASLFSVSPASLGASGGNLTVTYSPTAVGTHTATLTLSSTGAQDVTISLNGSCVNELTICDGNTTSSYLPVYGTWYDASSGQLNQMIYPASELTSLMGKDITSMTFYAPNGIQFSNGSVTFSIGETNTSAFSSATALTDNVTPVATVVPAGETEWKITFSDPYTYNGGNLLVQVNTVTGTYAGTNFTAMEMGANLGFYSYNSSQYTQTVLPKVTFTYEESGPKHDMGIALSAPASAGAGSTVNVTATVTNSGDFAENGYTVTVTDGTNIVTITATEALPVGQSAEFTVQFTTSTNDAGQTVNYTATVACTDDAVATNNSASASTSLINLPPPENVAATTHLTNATVTWEPPIIGLVTETEFWGFEEDTQNNTNTSLPAGWTTIDADGDTYAWYHLTGENFKNHTGIGHLTSASYQSNTALTPDNWLISPEITLGGTLTFWACGQDANDVAENFAVYVYPGSYSSGTNGFIKVGADVTTTGTMTDYTFDLSQYSGAGRIAIRHYNCTDMFRLNIDDVTIENSVPGEQPTSYNVYLDGTLVGSVNANDPLTYDFSNLTDGQHTAEISAVYTLGESALVPATFTISSTNPELAISPADQTIDDNAAGILTVTGTDITGNISVSAADNTNWSLNPTSLSSTGGDVNVSYTGRDLSATTTVTASATGATDATATVNYVADLYIVGDFGSGWDFTNGTHMTYSNGTYTATITANANSYILFARLLGNSNPWNTRDVFGPDSNGNWTMQGNSYGGNLNLNASNCIHFPEGGTYTVTIDATNGTFTITKLSENQTATPVITYNDNGESVTITATGNGTVTLTVGSQTVSGDGSASITIPYGPAATTVTATATAQEDGKDESAPANAQVPIPGGGEGWTEMTGTYTNDNDLLSFLTIVNGDTTDIMMVDQFMVSTLNNDHPDHYDYVMTETINGEVKYSNEVDIPVYKTNSSIQGLYTQTQVDSLDLKMGLRANVVNTKMDYDVNPDHNVLYYSLYRSDLDATYPEITVDSRISQLQKFEDNVDDNIQYYMFENHPTGVAPRYEHLGHEIAERLDTNWVECDFGQKLAYVPVIWTFGLYSGREDGKNNSYGSDIKREELGAVTVTVEGKHSDGSSMGKFTYNGQEYCIYHPVFNIEATAPQTITQGDGDVCTYVPYMYRAWCTYEGMRDYTADENGLKDNGPLAAPYLLGEEVTTNSQCHIGKNWAQGDGRLQNGFAIPTSVPDGDVTFIVRFYYKKEVAEAQSNGNKLRLGNGEGEEYFIAQAPADGDSMVTGISELMNGVTPVSVTYVNTQGMKSDKPFDGVNIVVTRYSDGSTVTSKIIR